MTPITPTYITATALKRLGLGPIQAGEPTAVCPMLAMEAYSNGARDSSKARGLDNLA
jgi:hypothetical protein